jgi:predicted DCC family thiol-disulfide oxidoreductase YuxK
VQWILRRDRRGSLRFAALEGAYGAAVRGRHPEIAGIDSMVWVEPAAPGESERVSVRSTAALRIARYLGGIWCVSLVASALPRALRDAAYDLITRHRHHLFGASDTCLVPGPDIRGRFLD